MAVATVNSMLVSLKLGDMPVGYAPPVGPPVRFVATYNHRESGQPANFSYSNLGPKWTFNWLAYILDIPSSPSAIVGYYTDGGGILWFSGFDTNSGSFAPEVKSQTLLTRTTPNSYVLLHPNGSQSIFAQPGATNGISRKVFLTQTVDPQGNSVRISYDNQFRVVALTDAIGQVTVFLLHRCHGPSENHAGHRSLRAVCHFPIQCPGAAGADYRLHWPDFAIHLRLRLLHPGPDHALRDHLL